MPRFDQRDKDGALLETYVISEATLKKDPDALLRSWSAEASKPRSAPSGYEYIASVDGDPDGLRTEGVTHYYAKIGSYEKEKPSKLAGLKAVVAETETKVEPEKK
jgi:hypothetical protein